MDDSVRETLMQLVKARMQTITTTNNYETNIGSHAFLWKASDWSDDELDGVNIRDHQDDANDETPLPREHHILTVDLEAAIANGTDTIKTVRKAIADIYTAIGTDIRWTSSGTRYAFDTRRVKDQIMLAQQKEKTYGVGVVTIAIHYRTSRFDPYTGQNQ